MEEISVIIPVYNVQKYLSRCLMSVITQTYNQLEIILIDDGSTDNSGKICDEYAKNDARISVIHKKNGGLSDARNVGIEKATAKYITFIDSDDYIHPNFIEKMYDLIIQYDADIVSVSSKSTSKAENIFVHSDKTEYENPKSFSTREAFEMLCYQKGLTHSIWGKLYRKELFNNVRFPKGKLYEDEATFYLLLAESKCTVCINEKLYAYFQRKDGIIRSAFNPQKMDYIRHTEQLKMYVEKTYPELKNAAISKLLWSNLHIWLQINNKREFQKEYSEIEETIKRYRHIVLFDPQVRKINKFLLLFSYLGHTPLQIAYKLKSILFSS